jgi:hypothetical protein
MSSKRVSDNKKIEKKFALALLILLAN